MRIQSNNFDEIMKDISPRHPSIVEGNLEDLTQLQSLPVDQLTKGRPESEQNATSFVHAVALQSNGDTNGAIPIPFTAGDACR